jgi:hypothetical protein
VTVGGQQVSVAHDVANVAILPKRKRGSYVVPLEEIMAEEREAKGGAESGKKAS